MRLRAGLFRVHGRNVNTIDIIELRMGITALQAHGEGLGAAGVGEYRGATTAARFGDPQAEFAALRSGCGVYDLGFRAKISLTRRRSRALAERHGHEQYSRPGGGSRSVCVSC